MRDLITDLIPHAPQHGLYVGELIPSDKLQAAIRDYAADVSPADVIALYDATLLGNARDGALFLPDRLVFENNDLQGAQTVLYRDIVGVEERKRLLGGRSVMMDVNRGRATFRLGIDFSGKPDAAAFVARFLHEAMVREPRRSAGDDGRIAQVRMRLRELVTEGLLNEAEMQEMLRCLSRG